MAAVEIKNLTFTYPGNKQPTLNQVTANIPTGQWTTIIGHNGSGKSTLARLIDGLLPSDKGMITVNGLPVDDDHLDQIHQQIGFVFQDPDNQFVGTTVADDVAFGLENHQVPRSEMDYRIKQALNDVDMLAFADRQPSMLSGGQKQRVAIASALCLRPKILIFDEATSMLDPQARTEILNLLARLKVEKGFTIIAISHNLEEAFEGDNVMVLDQSKMIAFGPTKDIMSNEELLASRQLGLPFALQLRRQLRLDGVEVPNEYQSEEQILSWLSQQSRFEK